MVIDWYKKVDSDLMQGDIITNCPILIPPESIEIGKVRIRVKETNVIILSQSCDLDGNKIENVLVCPYYPLSIYFEEHPDQPRGKKNNQSELKKLTEGNQPGYHLLNKQNNILDECQVVDFKNVYAVNIKFLRNYINSLPNRYRMNSPYREHLSQAFARFMMRVGLPQSIDCFKE